MNKRERVNYIRNKLTNVLFPLYPYLCCNLPTNIFLHHLTSPVDRIVTWYIIMDLIGNDFTNSQLSQLKELVARVLFQVINSSSYKELALKLYMTKSDF